MMQLWENGVVAALAAIGLAALVFLPASLLLRPRRRDLLDTFAALPCRKGEGARLEQTVRALERSRREYGGFCRIVILDCGMDEDTREIATLLCRDHCGVALRDDTIFTLEDTQ